MQLFGTKGQRDKLKILPRDGLGWNFEILPRDGLGWDLDGLSCPVTLVAHDQAHADKTKLKP